MPPKSMPLQHPCTMIAAWRLDFRRSQHSAKQPKLEGEAVQPEASPCPPIRPAPASEQQSLSSPEVSTDSGTSDSDDPESRKARKLPMSKRQSQDHQPQAPGTTAGLNPFVYAMQHGKFPKPQPGSAQHQQPEHPMLSDPGYLWNAVPPRSCQYLDLEAAHVGSTTSEGSTGSSEGSLSDPEFIVKDLPHETHSEEELLELQRLFPKTFKPKPA
jgi:hypothetical protein